jgi:hypothetical protein
MCWIGMGSPMDGSIAYATMLFSPPLIGDMAWRAKTTRAWQRSGNHPQPDKLIDEEENILNFLSVQSEEIENVFKPYLDLSRAGLKSYWPW